MARSAGTTRQVTVPLAAGDTDAAFTGAGVLQMVTFVGGAAAKVTIFEGLTVAGGETIVVLQNLSTTVPGVWPLRIPFETGLSVKVEGTCTTTIDLVIE